MRYLPSLDRAAAKEWVGRMRDHWDRHGFGQCVVELPGEASVHRRDRPKPRALDIAVPPAVEVGWRLARPYWGMGYALEAARAAIDDGFGRLGLAEIVAYTVPANRPPAGHGASRHEPRPGRGFRPSEPAEGHPLRRHVLYRLRRLAA